MSATGASYQEVSGLDGGGGSVFPLGWRVCAIVVFEVVFEPFPSGPPDIPLEGFFVFFGGGLAP